MENKATVNNSERATYWEELLRDKYEVHQVEEFNAMGKIKRSRKQMVSVEDDDLAGLEDVSTDGEDDNYEAEADSSDGETASPGAPVVRKAHRKKACDGVPKEGLRIQDVLVRIAILLLIRDKVKAFSEKTGGPLFAEDILFRLPGLKGGKLWKEEHDLLLLRAVLNSCNRNIFWKLFTGGACF